MRTSDISLERKFEFLNSKIICSLRKVKHILNKYYGEWEHEMKSKIRRACLASLRSPVQLARKTYRRIFTTSAQLSTC